MGTIRKCDLAAGTGDAVSELTRALDGKVQKQFKSTAQRNKLAMWATICGAPSLHRDVKKADRIFCGWDEYSRR